ncbi:hypothetical protein DENSPDRAFT_79380 [Dentipellis sp. KUC8613]|nr:hypothetical protein DENSPDRAFT_79380 [Dentipellis sp. KUC8613]
MAGHPPQSSTAVEDNSLAPAAVGQSLLSSLPPRFESHKDFFIYVQSLLVHAFSHRPNESALYAVFGHIFTFFSFSASVKAKKKGHHNFFLACMPQRDIVVSKSDQPNTRRIPDFIAMVTHGLPLAPRPSGFNPAVFLVEIKAGPYRKRARWYSQTGAARSGERVRKAFVWHFPQVAEQARYARESYASKSRIFILLIIDVWFSMFQFVENPPSLPIPPVFPAEDPPASMHTVYAQYCLVPQTPIFNNDWSSFTPKFLMALQTMCEASEDFTIVPHEFFRPPAGTPEESASVKLGADAYNAELAERKKAREEEDRIARGSDSATSASMEPASDPDDKTYHGRKTELPPSDRLLRGKETAQPAPALGSSRARRTNNSRRNVVRGSEEEEHADDEAYVVRVRQRRKGKQRAVEASDPEQESPEDQIAGPSHPAANTKGKGTRASYARNQRE